MSSEETAHRCETPACRSDKPGGCSDCTLAYDCRRASTGVRLAWPLIALLVVAVLTLVFRTFGA